MNAPILSFMLSMSCFSSESKLAAGASPIPSDEKEAGTATGAKELAKEGSRTRESRLRTGDIVFQQSRSAQSRAIALATHSRYTHMGIVLMVDGRPSVLEAIQPVSLTGFDDWVARGVDGHVAVKRLVDADEVLTPQIKRRIEELGRAFLGRAYDTHFGWGDEELYCSELVFKLYERAVDVEIGQLQKLGSFDLSDPVVRTKLAERYGSDVPMQEVVISPQSMFESPLLVTVDFQSTP